MLTKIETPSDYFPKVYVYRRKDSGMFRWKYKLPNGFEFHCNAGQKEGQARKNARLKERDLQRGLFTEKEMERLQRDSTSGTLTIQQAVDRYLDLSGTEKSPSTRNVERCSVPALFRFFSDDLKLKFFHEIKQKHIQDFRDRQLKLVSEKELKLVSAKNHLAAVKAVFNWYFGREEILSNPGKKIKPIKVSIEDRARNVTFSPDAIKRLMAAVYESMSGFKVKLFALFLYATGLRKGEALHLEHSDIDRANRIVKIRSKPNCPTRDGMGWKPKRGKERDVPLNDLAMWILDQLPAVPSVGYVNSKVDGKLETKAYRANFIFVAKDKKRPGGWKRIDDVRGSWEGLLKAAGLWTSENEKLMAGDRQLCRHDLRRSWNDHATGFTIKEASKILGHNPDVNVNHYSGAGDLEQMREKMQRHPSNHLRLVKE